RAKPCGARGSASQAWACSAVSQSPKRSSTMARSPACAAAAASARPDSATISAGRGSRDEIECRAIGITEIETLRLLAFRDALQQRVLNAELDIADGKRAEPDAGRPGERRSVRLDVDALDAERRHRVDVRRHLEPLRGAQLGGGKDLYPRLARRHDHLAILKHRAPSRLVAAVGGDKGAAEALLELLGPGRHDPALIMGDERHLGARLGGDDADDAADDALGAEYRDVGAGQ